MKKMEKVHWTITYVACAKKIKLMNKYKKTHKLKRLFLFVLNVVLQCADNAHSNGSAGWD